MKKKKGKLGVLKKIKEEVKEVLKEELKEEVFEFVIVDEFELIEMIIEKLFNVNDNDEVVDEKLEEVFVDDFKSEDVLFFEILLFV